MKVLIAPNSLKHSLSAMDAAIAIEKGISACSNHQTTRKPIADGGDSTLEVLAEVMKAEMVTVKAVDALGRPCPGRFGWVEDSATAIVGLSEVSGIARLKDEERNPLLASTFGTGILIKAALERGARRILLGVGGSATVDSGLGMLIALGLKVFDHKGELLEGGPEKLKNMAKMDPSELIASVSGCEFKILCDVDNPFLGNKGAAPVFAPQKGASADQVEWLGNWLQRVNELFIRQFDLDISDHPRAGAAGGVAGGLYAIINANLVDGAEEVLSLIGFQESLKGADVLITAEGKLDNQTLSGKGPDKVVRIAHQAGLKTICLAGHIDVDFEQPNYLDVALSISNGAIELGEALERTETNLTNTACQIARLLA